MIKYIGPNGENWACKDFLNFCFTFTNPIWDSVIRDFDICTNCWCSDCGCCIGCGGINADFFGSHGYGCV